MSMANETVKDGSNIVLKDIAGLIFLSSLFTCLSFLRRALGSATWTRRIVRQEDG